MRKKATEMQNSLLKAGKVLSKTEKSLQLGRDRHITAVFTPKEKTIL